MTPQARSTRGRRLGAILTTEMIFVLPVMLVVGLVSIQFILIHATYSRVQSAAIAGAEHAANGNSIGDVHQQVGLMLGFLAGDYETKMQYVDDDGDLPVSGMGTIEANEDYVAVGVRYPMGLASTNYLGLLGSSVDRLMIRSVVCKKMAVDVDVDDP